jgi:hypothetical protein
MKKKKSHPQESNQYMVKSNSRIGSKTFFNINRIVKNNNKSFMILKITQSNPIYIYKKN